MYYIYHIPGKKVGVTRNLNKRVTVAQGYQIGEYEVLDSSDDINYISSRELELQLIYGYKQDRQSYKQVIKSNKMKLNVTEQTITFPCPLNKLKGQLADNIGMNITNGFGSYKLDQKLANFIASNAQTSMYNTNRCYVYNKALHEFYNNSKANDVNPMKHIDEALVPAVSQDMETFLRNILRSHYSPETTSVFTNIRNWATDKGIYDSGDSKTQYVKLMEEAGELAQAILKKDKPEVKDAIGDMIVVLTNLAHLEGFTVEDCIDSAYNVIKSRQGSMVNGTFVKNTL
jgi:NTP pyrophosphatase (non-canonical NTP hydrolase)